MAFKRIATRGGIVKPVRVGELGPKDLEALGILQEECAETIVELIAGLGAVIKTVSKVRRAGPDWKASPEHDPLQVTKRNQLENEIGDVEALIDELYDSGFLDRQNVERAKQAKRLKLSQWSDYLGANPFKVEQ